MSPSVRFVERVVEAVVVVCVCDEPEPLAVDIDLEREGGGLFELRSMVGSSRYARDGGGAASLS